MTGLVGAVVEAWDELRIHRVRVLLALIGVAVAVCAITGVTGAAQMLTQVYTESAERSSGRDVTLSVSMYPTSPDGSMPPVEEVVDELHAVAERHGAPFASVEIWAQVPYSASAGRSVADAMVVDVPYGVIHRIQPVQGRWFAESDLDLLAPVVVVNEAFLTALGVPDLTSRPTVLLGEGATVRTTVVGVVPDQWEQESPRAFLLHAQAQAWGLVGGTDPWGGSVVPGFKVWVPPEVGEEAAEVLRRDLQATLPGMGVEVWPSMTDTGVLDQGARWVIIGIGAFTLLLGGLGLLNISLVTVRYRIREIGIRRSFGATSARVFLGVLMESVVATVVAGAVGVALAVAIISNLPVEAMFGTTLQDPPAFPVSAAALGMACATAVGALAGLVPALVAVRVKVIDAIRY